MDLDVCARVHPDATVAVGAHVSLALEILLMATAFRVASLLRANCPRAPQKSKGKLENARETAAGVFT